MPFDEEYYKSDEFHDLLESYETAAASGSTAFFDADDLVDIADYYNYTGDYDRAYEVVEQGLELYPGDVLLNVFMARQALMREDYDTAQDYTDAIGDKDAPDYHYMVAELMIAQGETDKADEYLREQFRKVAPEEVNDFVKDVANLYVDYSLYDKSYEWMTRLTNDSSDDFKELMASSLYGTGRYQEAIPIFNDLLDRHPFTKSYWMALASAQYETGEYNDALASSEYAIAIDPKDAFAVNAKANALSKLGNFEQAIRFYRKYNEMVPKDPLGLMNEAVCLINTGQSLEALEKLKTGLATFDQEQMDDQDRELMSQIYQEMAFCYSAMDDTDKALEALDSAKEMSDDEAGLLVIRGHICLHGDRLSDAEKAFREAINLSQEDPSIFLRIITSLYDNSFVKASYVMLKKFFQLTNCELPFSNAYMALFCWDLQRWDEFEVYLHKALRQNPHEVKMVMGHLLPDELPAENYEAYLKEQIRKIKQ